MNTEIHEVSTQFSNERGVIAEQYSQLQALHVLEAIKEMHPLPKASYESTIRAIFQATEVALLNIADLVSRATVDVRSRQFGAALVRMSWVRGFHHVMVRVSMMPSLLGGMLNTTGMSSELKIAASPAFQIYFESLKHFDSEMLGCIASGELPIEFLLSDQTLDNSSLHLLHLTRICNHETTIWENNLSRVAIPLLVSGYEEFVIPQGIREAVYNTELEEDTYYTQFRGLHQIPEILCAEINDHIASSILHIQAKFLPGAYEHLSYANILSEGILASLAPLTDNLTTSDYHKIRENLGLTSGSHSVNIHYHLFRDLYSQLWDELAKYLLGEQEQLRAKPDILKALRQVDQERFKDHSTFLVHLLANELLKLRTFTYEWRNGHLHLPRNNVGGSYTKSLTGAQDAVETVKKMRDIALLKDPMQPLVEARDLVGVSENIMYTPLTFYFGTQASLDKEVLEMTGDITKERFKHVQERTGIFAKKSPFLPPPKYEVK